MRKIAVGFLCIFAITNIQKVSGEELRNFSTSDFCKNIAASPTVSLEQSSKGKRFALDDESIEFCSYSGEDLSVINQSWASKNSVVAYQAQIQFRDTVELIRAYSRIKSKYNVMFASVPNAMAVLQKQGNEVERYVLYNAKYLCGIQEHTQSNWADDSVFAHEVGHHLPNHTLIGGSRPYFELQADWFSGYILQRMGAPLDEATIVLSKTIEYQINSKNINAPTSLTHPLLEDRIAAVSEGWATACEVDPKCELIQP